MRVVLCCSKYTSIELMLNALNWMSVKQRVYKTTLTFIHRLKQERLPEYLRELVVFNRNIHDYETRTRNDFHLTLKRTTKDGNYLMHKGLKAFNDLSCDVKGEINETRFKRKLVKHLKVTMPVG